MYGLTICRYLKFHLNRFTFWSNYFIWFQKENTYSYHIIYTFDDLRSRWSYFMFVHFSFFLPYSDNCMLYASSFLIYVNILNFKEIAYFMWTDGDSAKQRFDWFFLKVHKMCPVPVFKPFISKSVFEKHLVCKI